MMNKTKSAKVHLTRFLFVLPLLVIVLVAFRNTVQQAYSPKQNVLVNDTIPKWKGLPDNVKSIQTTSNGSEAITIVTLKDGKTEKYNLNNEQEKLAFEKKYGKLPEPPAPPEAPLAPVEPDEIETLAPPAKEIEMPLAPDFNCINKKGYCITVADNMGECVVIVKDKDMKIIEAIKMTDWNENEKKYEEKYGEIPPPPPPPVPPAKAKPAGAPKPPPPPAKGVSGVHIQTDDEVTATGTYEAVIAAGSGNVTTTKATGVNAPSKVTVSGRGVATTTSTINATVNGTNEVNVTGSGHATVATGGEEIEGEQEVLAVIKNTTTRDQLDQVLKDLKAKGYIMKFKDISFNDGKLTHIEGTVANEDGSSKWTFSATDFVKVSFTVAAGKKGSRFMNIIVSDGKVTV